MIHHKSVDDLVDKHSIKTSQYWIKMLKTLPQYQLGVIKSSGKLLAGDNLDQLCGELAYMAAQGFYLPLVIGGGVQYDKLPEYKGGKKVNDIRITSASLIEAMVPLALENQQLVVDTLAGFDTDSVAIPIDSVIVQPHGVEMSSDGVEHDTGYVGDVVSINTKPIISAIHNKQIPVLTHLGANNGDTFNINATTLAKELVKYMQAKKLIVVGNMPVCDNDGNIIKSIYSELEFNKLVQQGVITGGMVNNGQDAYDLLKYLGPGHSVQLTSLKGDNEGNIKSTGLLEEFLGDGSGTKICMPSVITTYPLDVVDKSMLTDLINNIFSEQGKTLDEDYFGIVGSKDSSVYLDSLNQGGAISYPINDCEYLCKIFTHKDYEGLGIATSTIETVIGQKGKIAWRTSNGNTCAIEKYSKIVEHYDGFVESGEKYSVFMIGVDAEKKDKVVKEVSSIPKTFSVM